MKQQFARHNLKRWRTMIPERQDMKEVSPKVFLTWSLSFQDTAQGTWGRPVDSLSWTDRAENSGKPTRLVFPRQSGVGKRATERQDLQRPAEESHLGFRWALSREQLWRNYLQERPEERTTRRDYKEQCCAHTGPFTLNVSLITLGLNLSSCY